MFGGRAEGSAAVSGLIAAANILANPRRNRRGRGRRGMGRKAIGRERTRAAAGKVIRRPVDPGPKKLARRRIAFSPQGMKTRRWIGVGLAVGVWAVAGAAEVPELVLPRPGAVVVADITGSAAVTVSGQRRVPKPEERLRIGSTLTTGRMSLFTVQLGSESEVELEEFGQAPVSGNVKLADLREEPTLSRTRLNLLRGDVMLDVKPLKVTRGSSFHLTLSAGTLRISEGTVRARVQMSDLGLGVATIELTKGRADFEVTGGTVLTLPAGGTLAFALEIDKTTGVTKVGAMPPPASKAKP